jgi:hypothetical protein
LEKVYKRYLSCYDDERDEIIKKLRKNGMRKLKNEMDLSRILKRMRDYDTMFGYLLTERQRFLLKFNDKHVIDSDSDLISLDSAQTLFSCETDQEDKSKSIRQHVMVKILEDEDIRNPDCAFRFVDKDLERGVGRTLLKGTEASEEIEEESYEVDSERLQEIRESADSSEIAPDIIGKSDDSESKPQSSSGKNGKKKKKTKDRVSAQIERLTGKENDLEGPPKLKLPQINKQNTLNNLDDFNV